MADITETVRPAFGRPDADLLLVDPSVKARQRENLIVNVSRVLLAVVFLGVWELASGWLAATFWVSKPSLIVIALGDLIASGQLFIAVLNTVLEALAGFLAGALLGIFLGVVFGVNRIIARVLDPYLVGLYSLPRVALVPLFILWFGIGFEMKVVFTALLVFFPIFMNTLAGVRAVDGDLIDVIRVMGASRWDAIRKVFIPSALSWVFAGLRISAPFALIGAVIAEMFSSNQGLGYLISQTANQFDTAGLFATLVVTTILGLALDAAVHLVERRLLLWQKQR
ncbi:ABC transporter permease [Sinorhizobium fredii]|uniref:ABC transporter permease n=1 Tax=Rhizobium fredii TaxID=380 RepID=UPI0006937461|nr:ABC transporter permease [Sinorhizobium fredii]WOS65493.1 ABC transporter permease [Sinorhizobium fredii GR64]